MPLERVQATRSRRRWPAARCSSHIFVVGWDPKPSGRTRNRARTRQKIAGVWALRRQRPALCWSSITSCSRPRLSGGWEMTFEELLDQAIAMLQRRGRVTYGALKRQFNLDNAYLEDLKAEIIKGQRLAVDEDGEVLVWMGGTASPSTPTAAPALAQERPPLAYTPSHLTEKILASRASLEGERKQVTVLFADIKDSTELIRDLDPEAAQQLLDTAIHRMMDAVHRFE